MDKIFLEFGDEPKVSVIKDKSRDAVINDLMEHLAERYDVAKKVGTNEIGVVVGTANDEDGYSSDVVVVIKATVKSWYNKPATTAKGRDVVKYELDDEAYLYDEDVKAKAAKKKGSK